MKYKVLDYTVSGNTITLQDTSLLLKNLVSILNESTVSTLGVMESILYSPLDKSRVTSMVNGVITLSQSLSGNPSLAIQVDDGKGLKSVENTINSLSTELITTHPYAKESSIKDGNDTAIGAIKDVRSEIGTGSDTATENGTLFAVVKWVKNKVKDIYTSLSNHIAEVQTTHPYAKELTSLTILSDIGDLDEIIEAINGDSVDDIVDNYLDGEAEEIMNIIGDWSEEIENEENI